jgi:hypothetical protein
MLNRLLYIGGLGLLLFSCEKPSRPNSGSWYLPNVDGQKVITSLINTKTKTIAICYGNDPAVRAANDPANIHQAGQSYTLITWSQTPMPHWYGTNMNREVISVEKVNVSLNYNRKIFYTYQLQSSRESRIKLQQQKTKERIRFIINLRAAVFPN